MSYFDPYQDLNGTLVFSAPQKNLQNLFFLQHFTMGINVLMCRVDDGSTFL